MEIGDRVMDREVKTPRGLQPLHDPLASPYWPVARRVLDEYPTQNRFRLRANRPRYDEGEESPAANSSCAPRRSPARTTTRNPISRRSANPHVHNSRLPTFKRQQEALTLHTAAKTGKASVGADDAVAGDDDGDSIASVRPADRARRPRRADHGGDLAIRTRFAERDRRERAPDPLLEVGAVGRERQVECLAASSEIRVELLTRRIDDRVRSRLRIGEGAAMFAVFERETAQRHIVCHESQRADRALVVVTDHGFGPFMSLRREARRQSLTVA